MIETIVADWPVPPRVRALFSTRGGGVSTGPYTSFNLGTQCGDDPGAVAGNRARLAARLPAPPVWLRQVHGTRVVRTDAASPAGIEADGAWTSTPGVVCAVLVADCIPVLLADRSGATVAAVHAGWRGLCAGILEAAVAAVPAEPWELLAWLGPAIGASRYEVGDEVRREFAAIDPTDQCAFRPTRPGHWHADLLQLARRRLARCGVPDVYGGHWCTATDAARFYSYRRDGTCGRMAACVWIEP